MVTFKNYFSNTVLHVLHNETKRIKFQIYNQDGGGDLERK
jgi:hypothetical protein